MFLKNISLKEKALGFVVILSFALFSCDEPVYTPKPRGYPRVMLPEKGYQKFDKTFCEFGFDYPKYATIEQDKMFFDEKAPSDCWFNIKIPNLNAEIYCSYYKINGINTLEKLRGDAFKLAGKHNVKADFIDELPIQKPNKVSGFLFNIEGPAACPFQFYLTDSTKHFMRGALYFNTEAKPDSLKPAVEFLKTDVLQMINSFEWRK
jgi:gliding motility-associated lipoprotein GldD